MLKRLAEVLDQPEMYLFRNIPAYQQCLEKLRDKDSTSSVYLYSFLSCASEEFQPLRLPWFDANSEIVVDAETYCIFATEAYCKLKAVAEYFEIPLSLSGAYKNISSVLNEMGRLLSEHILPDDPSYDCVSAFLRLMERHAQLDDLLIAPKAIPPIVDSPVSMEEAAFYSVDAAYSLYYLICVGDPKTFVDLGFALADSYMTELYSELVNHYCELFSKRHELISSGGWIKCLSI